MPISSRIAVEFPDKPIRLFLCQELSVHWNIVCVTKRAGQVQFLGCRSDDDLGCAMRISRKSLGFYQSRRCDIRSIEARKWVARVGAF